MGISCLTEPETRLFLDFIKTNHQTSFQRMVAERNSAIVLLMLDAGLRIGEVLKLDITDLCICNVIVPSLRVRAEISKSGCDRFVPLSSRIILALAAVKVSWWAMIQAAGCSYAFTQRKNWTRLTTRQVERIVMNAGKRAIGRPVWPHMLRHTFATNLMRVTDMRTVQELLGHKSLTSTEIYTHTNDTDKSNAIKALENSVTANTDRGEGPAKL